MNVHSFNYSPNIQSILNASQRFYRIAAGGKSGKVCVTSLSLDVDKLIKGEKFNEIESLFNKLMRSGELLRRGENNRYKAVNLNHIKSTAATAAAQPGAQPASPKPGAQSQQGGEHVDLKDIDGMSDKEKEELESILKEIGNAVHALAQEHLEGRSKDKELTHVVERRQTAQQKPAQPKAEVRGRTLPAMPLPTQKGEKQGKASENLTAAEKRHEQERREQEQVAFLDDKHQRILDRTVDESVLKEQINKQDIANKE